jgi:hypothetical protein
MTTKRNILGPSADNGLKSATAVSGDDTSLDRATYAGPVSMTSEQSSIQTASEQAGLQAAYKEAQDAASTFEGSGASGVALSRKAE